MAWLNATPKPARPGKGDDADRRATRQEQMKQAGLAVQMPPNPAPHIINWLIEIGLTGSNGMAATPLDWREIEAWQRMTGVCLNAFEGRLIRKLSVEYVAEGRRAEDERCSAPWAASVSDGDRKISEAKLRMVLG